MSDYILVVDDDPDVRTIVTTLLTMYQYTVKEAGNGAEALALIEGDPPSLMLLDMQMPMLNGPGLIRRLQERGEWVPTIVMTAAGDARRQGLELGADAYLNKPFNLDELAATVARIRSLAPVSHSEA
jgi:DNA-binding response OmpR family regulator